MQNVLCSKIVSLRILRASNALGRFLEIVRGTPQLNAGSEQEPIGTGFAKRHSHAASIHDSNLSNGSVELHVGVTANDHIHVESVKHRQEPVFRCTASKSLALQRNLRVNTVNKEGQSCLGYRAIGSLCARGIEAATNLSSFRAVASRAACCASVRSRTRGASEIATVNLRPDAFHGEWNYAIRPRTTL